MTESINWANLPSLVLEKIFLNLDFAERYHCSQVCQNWFSSYLNSKELLTKLNLIITYSPLLINLQQLLDSYIEKFGRHIKCLKIIINCSDLTDLGKYLLNFSLVRLFKSLYNLNANEIPQQLVKLEIQNLKITNLPQFIL